jgi:hypothetical protein
VEVDVENHRDEPSNDNLEYTYYYSSGGEIHTVSTRSGRIPTQSKNESYYMRSSHLAAMGDRPHWILSGLPGLHICWTDFLIDYHGILSLKASSHRSQSNQSNHCLISRQPTGFCGRPIIKWVDRDP